MSTLQDILNGSKELLVGAARGLYTPFAIPTAMKDMKRQLESVIVPDSVNYRGDTSTIEEVCVALSVAAQIGVGFSALRSLAQYAADQDKGSSVACFLVATNLVNYLVNRFRRPNQQRSEVDASNIDYESVPQEAAAHLQLINTAQNLYDQNESRFVQNHEGEYVTIALAGYPNNLTPEYFFATTEEGSIELARKDHPDAFIYARKIGELERVTAFSPFIAE